MAAIVALALLIFRNLLTLLVVIGALAVAGAAAWAVLSRTGVIRIMAAAIALASLVGAAVALVVRGALDELVALIVIAVVFGVAARTAIRNAAAERLSVPRSDDSTRLQSSRRTRAVVILNPKSGGGKVERFKLVEEAKRRSIDTVLLQPGDDLRELARHAAAGAGAIGMAGGDGSQALVAEIAAERGIPYVCIPAGTRNHLALDLGLDRSDVAGALDAFDSAISRTVDIGFVNDRIFLNNVSLGIYAEIVQSESYRDAKLQTMQQMVPQFLGPNAQPFDLRYRGPADDEHSSAQLVLVSNNPYQLDRLAGMGSRPRLDTGLLGIVTIDIRNASDMAQLFSLEALGQVRLFGGWREWTATEFEVISAKQVAAGIDGEGIMLEPPLRFGIAPGALHILLPPNAPGLSPAALAPGLNREGALELWRIATGKT
jgi:diacylglycerol kinase family enzyme